MVESCCYVVSEFQIGAGLYAVGRPVQKRNDEDGQIGTIQSLPLERGALFNIRYHLPRCHRSSRGVERKKQNLHPFIVASFNAQSVKGNDMACKRCEISTFIKDNGVDLLFVTETWLSAQGNETKTVELAPSGFDVKSFPRQSRSHGGGIVTVYKSTFGSNITFKTNFYFTHSSFKVVQASITLQHNTLHFFFMYRPPPNRQNNLKDSMLTAA